MTARPVTTTDLWKLVGLVLVLIDHWGLLFADDPSWRVVGRAAAPIFFFFIGLARTRQLAGTSSPPTPISVMYCGAVATRSRSSTARLRLAELQGSPRFEAASASMRAALRTRSPLRIAPAGRRAACAVSLVIISIPIPRRTLVRS